MLIKEVRGVEDEASPLYISILGPGARPTNDISIEFEIWPKFDGMWLKTYCTDHNKILYTSRQCNCRGVCKISLLPVEYIC